MATTTRTTLPSSPHPHSFGMRIAVAVLGMLALAGLVAAPAAALSTRGVLPGGGGIIAPPDPCQGQPQVISFTPTDPMTVMFGDSVTLSWNVQVPSGCNSALYVNGQRVGLQGSLQVQPVFDHSYSLALQWGPNLGLYIGPVYTAKISVACCPKDPSDPTGTRNLVTISSQQMVAMFARALRTPNTTVNLTADLDLTGLPNWNPTVESRILITDGVHLIGGRTAAPGQPFRPGPLLSVTDYPSTLFEIRGDNVRVTGVRIQGASMTEDQNTSSGIKIIDVMPSCGPQNPDGSWPACPSIPGHTNVEIDHNEFSGWSDTALGVADPYFRISVGWFEDHTSTPAQLVYYKNEKTEPVWIHDNFIHHNQHQRTNGYGVGVGQGAHALIERNVFDWNRHAITSGRNDSFVGYRAYRNLVLENGGHNLDPDPVVVAALGLLGPLGPLAALLPWFLAGHVQQFDMHGSNNCPGNPFIDHFCGIAGRDFDVRYNSFLYKKAPAILLRGTPSLGLPMGATMRFNVFAHDHETDAVKWNEGAPHVQDNLTGRTTYFGTNTCDFDGDGINDTFIATEQTLWYCPGPNDCVTAPGSGKPTWVYLNMSTKRVDELALGYFSGRHVCDIVDGNLISVGGSGPWKPLSAGFKQ